MLVNRSFHSLGFLLLTLFSFFSAGQMIQKYYQRRAGFSWSSLSLFLFISFSFLGILKLCLILRSYGVYRVLLLLNDVQNHELLKDTF